MDEEKMNSCAPQKGVSGDPLVPQSDHSVGSVFNKVDSILSTPSSASTVPGLVDSTCSSFLATLPSVPTVHGLVDSTCSSFLSTLPSVPAVPVVDSGTSSFFSAVPALQGLDILNPDILKAILPQGIDAKALDKIRVDLCRSLPHIYGPPEASQHLLKKFMENVPENAGKTNFGEIGRSNSTSTEVGRSTSTEVGRSTSTSNDVGRLVGTSNDAEKLISISNEVNKHISTSNEIGKLTSTLNEIGRLTSSSNEIGMSNLNEVGKLNSNNNDFRRLTSNLNEIGWLTSASDEIGRLASTFNESGRSPSTMNEVGMSNPALNEVGRSTSTMNEVGRLNSTLNEGGRSTSTMNELGRSTSTSNEIGRSTSTMNEVGRSTSTSNQTGRSTSTMNEVGRSTSTSNEIGRLTTNDVGRFSTNEVMGKKSGIEDYRPQDDLKAQLARYHSTYLLRSFRTLRNEEYGLDTIILCDGGHVKAHCCILACVSPFLKMVLSECKDFPAVLSVPGVSLHTIERLISCIYYGSLPTTVNISELVDVASHLGMTSLVAVFKKSDLKNQESGSNRSTEEFLKKDLKNEAGDCIKDYKYDLNSEKNHENQSAKKANRLEQIIYKKLSNPSSNDMEDIKQSSYSSKSSTVSLDVKSDVCSKEAVHTRSIPLNLSSKITATSVNSGQPLRQSDWLSSYYGNVPPIMSANFSSGIHSTTGIIPATFNLPGLAGLPANLSSLMSQFPIPTSLNSIIQPPFTNLTFPSINTTSPQTTVATTSSYSSAQTYSKSKLGAHIRNRHQSKNNQKNLYSSSKIPTTVSTTDHLNTSSISNPLSMINSLKQPLMTPQLLKDVYDQLRHNPQLASALANIAPVPNILNLGTPNLNNLQTFQDLFPNFLTSKVNVPTSLNSSDHQSNHGLDLRAKTFDPVSSQEISALNLSNKTNSSKLDMSKNQHVPTTVVDESVEPLKIKDNDQDKSIIEVKEFDSNEKNPSPSKTSISPSNKDTVTDIKTSENKMVTENQLGSSQACQTASNYLVTDKEVVDCSENDSEVLNLTHSSSNNQKMEPDVETTIPISLATIPVSESSVHVNETTKKAPIHSLTPVTTVSSTKLSLNHEEGIVAESLTPEIDVVGSPLPMDMGVPSEGLKYPLSSTIEPPSLPSGHHLAAPFRKESKTEDIEVMEIARPRSIETDGHTHQLKKLFQIGNMGRKRKGCGDCDGCQVVEDCGGCRFCRDKAKFGGPNRLKQVCAYKRCLVLDADQEDSRKRKKNLNRRRLGRCGSCEGCRRSSDCGECYACLHNASLNAASRRKVCEMRMCEQQQIEELRASLNSGEEPSPYSTDSLIAEGVGINSEAPSPSGEGSSLAGAKFKLKASKKGFKRHGHAFGNVSPSKVRTKYYCGECPGCLTTTPCGHCLYCEDMPKFGGPGRYRQKCVKQLCVYHPRLQALKLSNRGKVPLEDLGPDSSTLQNVGHGRSHAPVSTTEVDTQPRSALQPFGIATPEHLLANRPTEESIIAADTYLRSVQMAPYHRNHTGLHNSMIGTSTTKPVCWNPYLMQPGKDSTGSKDLSRHVYPLTSPPGSGFPADSSSKVEQTVNYSATLKNGGSYDVPNGSALHKTVNSGSEVPEYMTGVCDGTGSETKVQEYIPIVSNGSTTSGTDNKMVSSTNSNVGLSESSQAMIQDNFTPDKLKLNEEAADLSKNTLFEDREKNNLRSLKSDVVPIECPNTPRILQKPENAISKTTGASLPIESSQTSGISLPVNSSPQGVSLPIKTSQLQGMSPPMASSHPPGISPIAPSHPLGVSPPMVSSHPSGVSPIDSSQSTISSQEVIISQNQPQKFIPNSIFTGLRGRPRGRGSKTTVTRGGRQRGRPRGSGSNSVAARKSERKRTFRYAQTLADDSDVEDGEIYLVNRTVENWWDLLAQKKEEVGVPEKGMNVPLSSTELEKDMINFPQLSTQPGKDMMNLLPSCTGSEKDMMNISKSLTGPDNDMRVPQSSAIPEKDMRVPPSSTQPEKDMNFPQLFTIPEEGMMNLPQSSIVPEKDMMHLPQASTIPEKDMTLPQLTSQPPQLYTGPGRDMNFPQSSTVPVKDMMNLPLSSTLQEKDMTTLPQSSSEPKNEIEPELQGFTSFFTDSANPGDGYLQNNAQQVDSTNTHLDVAQPGSPIQPKPSVTSLLNHPVNIIPDSTVPRSNTTKDIPGEESFNDSQVPMSSNLREDLGSIEDHVTVEDITEDHTEVEDSGHTINDYVTIEDSSRSSEDHVTDEDITATINDHVTIEDSAGNIEDHITLKDSIEAIEDSVIVEDNSRTIEDDVTIEDSTSEDQMNDVEMQEFISTASESENFVN